MSRTIKIASVQMDVTLAPVHERLARAGAGKTCKTQKKEKAMKLRSQTRILAEAAL